MVTDDPESPGDVPGNSAPVPAMPDQIGRRSHLWIALALLLVGAGLVAIGYGVGLFQGGAEPPPEPPPAATPEERLLPTLTVQGTSVVPSRDPTASASPLPTAAESPTSTAPSPVAPSVTVPSVPTATQQLQPGLFSPRQRIGFVAPMRDVARYDVARLGAGWHISCQQGEDPVPTAGMECAQLVGSTGGVSVSDLASLRETAARKPGKLWLVGNEPDVLWQLNATPEEYAHLYHDVHKAIKEADPASQVAIGGISQVTPLRLRYLEEVMAAYAKAYSQPMPVDVWNIHLAILREERGSWGVDIPPGMHDDTGILYEIEDNGDVEILKSQVMMFRRWLADQGLRDKPLIVTEFSVLMPEEYGFPLERVRTFMIAAFDFLMTATDKDVGYAADGNRLVQRWAWYSIADRSYSTGNLFDPDTGQITPLGEAFAAYAAGWQ